jgi:hypothetical protein
MHWHNAFQHHYDRKRKDVTSLYNTLLNAEWKGVDVSSVLPSQGVSCQQQSTIFFLEGIMPCWMMKPSKGSLTSTP